MFANRQQSLSFEPSVSLSPLEQIQQKVAQCMKKADTFFGKHFLEPQSNMKQRGRAAGTAHLQKNELRFNLFMFEQDQRLFLETVVPHEVAHLIVFQIYGDKVRPHGREWQAVMKKVYGLEPNRTHNFNVPAPKQVFVYQCQCQQHKFTKQRHTRARKGTEYICKLCRSPLHYSPA